MNEDYRDLEAQLRRGCSYSGDAGFCDVDACETDDCMTRAADAIAKQRAEIERLRKVLAFYADPFSARDEFGEKYDVPDFYDDMDFGEQAQKALGE